VSFKEQLYSELQSQLTQTRLDLQRRQPVVTVVEEPVPPIDRSAPRRTLIFVASLLLSVFLGVAVVLVRFFLTPDEEEQERREKLKEIKQAFISKAWTRSA
jgi:uncharacterized protein involved in exopolysaccharide biosynthesis